MFDNDKLLFSAKNEMESVVNTINAYDDFVVKNEVGKAKQQFQVIARIILNRQDLL